MTPVGTQATPSLSVPPLVPQADTNIAARASTASVLQCILETLPRAKKARRSGEISEGGGRKRRALVACRLCVCAVNSPGQPAFCRVAPDAPQVVEDHTKEHGVVFADSFFNILGSQDRCAWIRMRPVVTSPSSKPHRPRAFALAPCAAAGSASS